MLCACATGGEKQPTHPDFVIDVPLSSDHEENGSVALAPRTLQAETALSKPTVFLEDLLQVADEHNPEIQAAREEISFSSKLWQTEPLLNSMTQCQSQVIPLHDDASVQSKTRFFSIKKIIPQNRKEESAIGTATSAEAESRFFRFQQKRQEVFGQIHALFIELLYFKHAQALYQQLIQDSGEAFRVASLRKNLKTVSDAGAPEPGSKLIEFERASWRLTRERQTGSQRLDALLGGVHVPVDRLSGQLLDDFPRVEPAGLFSALEKHPELLAARKDAEAAACRLNQAREQRKTDVDFRLGIGRDLWEGDRNIMGGLSIPLPEFGRKKESTRDAENLAQRVSDAAAAVEDDLRAELRAAHSEYLSAQDRLAVSRDRIVPNAEEAFVRTQGEYQEGKRDLLDLVDARVALTDARLSYLAQLRDCNLAHAKIINLTKMTDPQGRPQPAIGNPEVLHELDVEIKIGG